MDSNLELIKKDPYINEIIKKYNLSDSFLEQNISKLVRVLESRSKCSGCKGLYCCSQKSVGERYGLSFDKVLFEEIEYCEYGADRLKKDNLSRSYLYCDVPDKLIDVDLNNIKPTNEQNVLFVPLYDIYENVRTKGLYIAGDLGVGKTYLCVALANSLVKKGEKVAFVKVSDFFNEMKSYFSSRSDLIDINMNKLQKAKYLFLDDIGSEAVSEFVRDDTLFRILDYRLENNLTTIFTSNLNKSELEKHYTYDRNDKSNAMKAKRLMERIDILSDNIVLAGKNMRRQ